MPKPVRLGQKPSELRKTLHGVNRKLKGQTVPAYGYDGINSDAPVIKANAGNPAFVAGYDDGAYAWSAADVDLWAGTNTTIVAVTISASHNEGDVLDVENGDATPQQTESWISLRKASGYNRPTIYCSAAVVNAVRFYTGKWVLNVDYDLWVADWVGHPFQYVCSDGKPCAVTQYASGSWADYDVCYDPGWPHRTAVAPPPPPPPAPSPPTPEPELQLGATGSAVKLLQTLINGRPVVTGHEIAALVVDGDFGAKTDAAVRLIQGNNGLVVDGVVGPKTWAVLGNYS